MAGGGGTIIDPWNDDICRGILECLEQAKHDLVPRDIREWLYDNNVVNDYNPASNAKVEVRVEKLVEFGFVGKSAFGTYILLNRHVPRPDEETITKLMRKSYKRLGELKEAFREEDLMSQEEAEKFIAQRKQEGAIKLKVGQGCFMFKCLLCWKYVLPDDDISEYNDGYCHTICKKKAENVKASRQRQAEWNKKSTIKRRDRLRKRANKLLGNKCSGCGHKDCKFQIRRKDGKRSVIYNDNFQLKKLSHVIAHPEEYLLYCGTCASGMSFGKRQSVTTKEEVAL